MQDWNRQSGFTINQWQVLPLLGELRRNSETFHIEPKVMDVLVFLAERPGEVAEREAIIEAVWGGRIVSDDPLSKCIAELRKVLGDSARESHYIGTVPKRGYRLLQPVEPISNIAVPVSGRNRHRLVPLVIAMLAAMLVATVFLGTREFDEPAGGQIDVAHQSARQTLAVLPLVIRSPNAEDAYIADGLHDDLLTQLARIQEWDVISRTSVERFRDTDDDMAEIADSLNATLVLEGGVQRNGRQLRINLQLIDPAGDSHLWAETYDRELPVDDLFAVQSELVQHVVRELADALDAKQPVSQAAPTTDFRAYSEYVIGRRLVRTESVTALRSAAEHFNLAIEIDPDYAQAHAALADAYLRLAIYFYGGMQATDAIKAAEPHILRAIELDPELAEAYVANATLQILLGDATAAEEAIELALELQPSYAHAHRVLANLRWRQDRKDEAIELAQHASLLDPLSGVIQLELGRYYEAVARYDDAVQNFLIAVRVLPHNALVRLHMGALKYLVYGDVAESLVWYRKAAELDPESPSMQVTPAFAYLEIGDLERARHHVDLGMALQPDLFWVRLVRMTFNLRLGNQAAALEDAQVILKRRPRQWDALRLLRDRDLDDGNIESALSRYSIQYPELTEPEKPDVNNENYVAAVDLALVYSKSGKQDKAMHLSAGALNVMEGLSRFGQLGYWLTDVGALAIRGEHDEAIIKLEQAVDEGFRIKLWYYLDIERNLEGLRELPRFQLIREKVAAIIQSEAEMAAAIDEPAAR
ncbi:MAG TPA: winged helix-turn-helix domain-containing protein [Woeseiaceae bacterium]|nr:winged helix-turn-helix domain-containing protein [Woeseiaceae bacterium]